MTRGDVPVGKGQCDIRLRIDGEAEVSVRGDLVYIRTISGRDGRDDGSECNEPLPSRNPEGFRFEVHDGRGEIRLLSEPSRRSDYQAIVRIRDGAGGEGRYHFRLSWMMAGEGFPGRRRDFDGDDGRRGGLVWNNAAHFTGRGRGSYGSERLSDASVDIDRGGRILVSFRTESGRPLNFTADVAGDGPGRLRGSMFLSRDARGEIDRISLDATNGRDRLHLDWERR